MRRRDEGQQRASCLPPVRAGLLLPRQRCSYNAKRNAAFAVRTPRLLPGQRPTRTAQDHMATADHFLISKRLPPLPFALLLGPASADLSTSISLSDMATGCCGHLPCAGAWGGTAWDAARSAPGTQRSAKRTLRSARLAPAAPAAWGTENLIASDCVSTQAALATRIRPGEPAAVGCLRARPLQRPSGLPACMKYLKQS
jgi:hypothetical protein